MFEVFTFLSGIPFNRGHFATMAEAVAKQAELHRQGWYFVPILTGKEAEQHNAASRFLSY